MGACKGVPAAVEPVVAGVASVASSASLRSIPSSIGGSLSIGKRQREQAQRKFARLIRSLEGHTHYINDNDMKATVQITIVRLQSRQLSIADLSNFRLPELKFLVEVCVTKKKEVQMVDSALKGVSLMFQAGAELEAKAAKAVGICDGHLVASAADKAGMIKHCNTSLLAHAARVEAAIAISVSRGGAEVTARASLGEDAATELSGLVPIAPAKVEQCLSEAVSDKVRFEILAETWMAIEAHEIKASSGTAKYHQRESHWIEPPGRHKYIRKRMDYSYFVQVTDERVAWQDELIANMLFAADSLEGQKRLGEFSLPWVVYSAGGMGAGKGFVSKWMSERGYLPTKSFVGVDPDAIRKLLPEWEKVSREFPEEAGYLTQMEATNIADIVSKKALANRFCVFIDGSLRATDWYKNVEFPLLRQLFPGIRIMIIHVIAEPAEECITRAVSRAQIEGRAVPKSQVESSISDSARSVIELAVEADFVVRVLNRTGQDPELCPVVLEGATINPTPELLEQRGGWAILEDCFKPLNSWIGDQIGAWMTTGGKTTKGFISKSTLQGAIERGVLTQRVVDSIDVSGDGYILPNEIALARQKAADWGEAFDHMHILEEDEVAAKIN